MLRVLLVVSAWDTAEFACCIFCFVLGSSFPAFLLPIHKAC